MTGNVSFNTQPQYILKGGRNINPNEGYVSAAKPPKSGPAEMATSPGNQRSFLNHLWQVAQKDPGFNTGSVA